MYAVRSTYGLWFVSLI